MNDHIEAPVFHSINMRTTWRPIIFSDISLLNISCYGLQDFRSFFGLCILEEYFVGSSYIENFHRIYQPIWNNKQPNVFLDFDDLFGKF